MDSTAIATTMPPGRYGARHIARWSVSVASCEATICCHRACARAVSARRMLECLTAACKALSLANGKGKGANGLVIGSLD